MDRDTCASTLSACESCLATFLMYRCYPDRACITAIEDDGQEVLELVLKFDGRQATLTITPEIRELVAFEGWSQFVGVSPAFLSPQARGKGVKQ
ncbi:MAG: hypothetical protein ACE5LU_20495 [Anaerolineae bacterium]